LLKSLNKKNIPAKVYYSERYMGKINTFLNDEYHRDIGTPKSYKLAQKEVLNFIY